MLLLALSLDTLLAPLGKAIFKSLLSPLPALIDFGQHRFDLLKVSDLWNGYARHAGGK